MTTAKIPVAIIGGGSIAPFHAKYIQASPTLTLVAIIDPFPPGEALAKTLAVAHYATIADLLAAASSSSTDPVFPQLYYICVPNSLHIQLATELINLTTTTSTSTSLTSRAKLRTILIEKPLSTSSVSGTEFLVLAQKHNIAIAAGHHRRFHPAIRAAKLAITQGRVGKISALSGSWTCKKNEGYFGLAWRRSRANGGGPVWTNFVHDVDLLCYLVGSGVGRVWVVGTTKTRGEGAETETAVNGEGISGSDAVEEGAAIMLQFRNGVVGTFILSDNVASPYSWEGATGENPLLPKVTTAIDCFRVFGSKATLTVPDGNLWTYRNEDAQRLGLEVGWNVPMVREVLDVEEGIPFQLQAEQLGRVVLGVEEPVCSGRDGLLVVKVCEAIVDALDRGDGLPIDID